MIRSAENIRVLFVVDEFPPSICGIGDYTAQLAQSLVTKGVEVGVLTKASAGQLAFESVDGVNVHRLAQGWKLTDVGPIMQTARNMGSGTIVHLQYPSLTGYHRRLTVNFLPALFRTMQRRTPLVVTMHGFHEHRLRWRLRTMPMLWANSAMVFVHPRDQELATRWSPFSQKRSALIPIASNVPALPADNARRMQVRADLGVGAEERVAVFFGEVRPDKGLQTLLDAAEAMKQRGIAARALVISTIGTHAHALSAYEREILARLGAGNREGWTKLVRAETALRAAEILGACDVAAFPFTLGAAENRGSLMAAVVNGLPVLTTRGSSTPANYETEYGVETVPANDPGKFGDRLETLLCNDAQRSALAAKSQAVAGRFTWSSIAEQNIEVYRKCLAN